MGKNYTYRLVEKLYKDNVSPELQCELRDWFVHTPLTDEKRAAMLDIWENHTAQTDSRTEDDLTRVWERINKYEGRAAVSPLFRKVLRAAAILLLPLIGAGLMYLLQPAPPPPPGLEITECFAPYGTREHVVFADGSEVWLNAGSLLVYDKNFDGTTRTVYLNGEANFNIVENPGKPFIVKTRYVETEVLGTVFNVQSYASADNTSVTLEQGSVKIKSKELPGGEFILLPNEQLSFDHTTRLFSKKSVDATRESLWKDGYMIFQARNFADIVETIERKFKVSVKYKSAKFEGRSFTIRFMPEEDLTRVLDIFKDIAEFKYRINEEMVYIY